MKYDNALMPNLEGYFAFIIAEMESKRILLEQLIIGVEQRKTNTVLVEQLFQIDPFDAIEARDAKATQIKRVAPTSSILSITGHVRSVNTKLYRIRHLTYYTSVGRTYIRHEYVGKSLAIRNSSIDCVRAVAETSYAYVDEQCDVPDFRDPLLKLWRTTNITNIKDEKRHPIYIRIGHSFIVSCCGNDIIITPLGEGNETSCRCPTYAFLLNDTFSFYTSDRLVNHTSKKNVHVELKNTKLDVIDFHFEHYVAAHELINNQFESIHNLTEEAIAAKEQFKVAEVFNEEVTWKHVSLVCLGIGGLTIIGSMVVCIHYKCKKSNMSKRFVDAYRGWSKVEEFRRTDEPRRISTSDNENLRKEVRELRNHILVFNKAVGNNVGNMLERRGSVEPFNYNRQYRSMRQINLPSNNCIIEEIYE